MLCSKIFFNWNHTFAILIFLFIVGCEAKVPEFAGIYVLNDGKYQEVSRFKDFKEEKFNYLKLYGMMSGTYCNAKFSIPRSKFIPINQEMFNKNGFLVVENKEWSGFQLFRVPIEGILKDNENGTDIVSSIGYGCAMRGRSGFFHRKLDINQEPTKVEIRQAKKGDNSFIYVPAIPVEKGYYLIDYKLNGQGHLGYNPILVN